MARGKLYYANKTGKCAVRGKKDGITFTKEGCAKDDVHSQLKMKCMQVVSQVTKSAMTQDQKLRACWYHLNTIRFMPRQFPDLAKDTWPQQGALDLLNTMGGNCYGFACAFAALARELGYEPYLIEIPKSHCWVRINGRYWDNMGNRMGTASSLHPYSRNQIFKYVF